MSASIRETAEFFRLMLLIGWVDKRCVGGWADTVFQTHPDPVLLDVVLSNDPTTNDLCEMLRNVSGALRPEVPALMLLAYTCRKLQNGNFSYQQAIEDLNHLAYDPRSDFPESIVDRIEDLEIELQQTRHHAASVRSDVEVKLYELLKAGDEFKSSLPEQCC